MEEPVHRCFACGYDLSTLPPRGKCPECGAVYSLPEHVPDERDMLDIAAVGRAKWRSMPFIAIVVLMGLILVVALRTCGALNQT